MCFFFQNNILDIASIFRMCLWKRQGKQPNTFMSILASSGVFHAILANLLFYQSEILKVYYFS